MALISVAFWFKKFVIDSLPLIGGYFCEQISPFWLTLMRKKSWCEKKSETFPEINNFSSPNVINFYNFRTQYGMGLVQPINVTDSISGFSCIFCVIFILAQHVFAARTSALGQPAQSFEGAKIFYFRLTTVFCVGYRLSKHKMTRYSKNLRRPWPPLATPMDQCLFC